MNHDISSVLHLEQRARAAKTLAELQFILANETWQVIGFQQALVWEVSSGTNPKLSAVSGLASLGEDSPFTAWLRTLAPRMLEKIDSDGVYFQAEDFEQLDAGAWAEWIPAYLLAFRLNDPQGNTVGMVAFSVAQELDQQQQAWALQLIDCFAHAWSALNRPAGRFRRNASARASRPWWKRWTVAIPLVLLACLFIPVRLSVLAPAEVIALDAQTVTSPLEGVIKTVHVQPNQMVKRGQLLFSLEDTTLRNRREVAQKQLAIARVESQAAQQKAIASDGSRQELASLQGKVAERLAEISALDDQLTRLEIKAQADGVIVFGDTNDWLGKPVVTGERLAFLADQNDAGLLIWLPVAEAITLEPGAELRFFLQVAPLSPMDAKLVQTSYQSSLSPEGIASYRLRARFDDPKREGKAEGEGKGQGNSADRARIGLKGTAKIFGEQAPLALYLFRRPLSSLREVVGW